MYGEIDRLGTLTGNKINGKMYNAIFHVYSGIKFRIVHNGQSSNYFPCNTNVRQGSNMFLFLFSLYLSDMDLFLQLVDRDFQLFTLLCSGSSFVY